MKITPKHIHEIAQELQCGMKVYVNRKNLEIKVILDWDNILDNEEFWEEELEKIEREWDDYIALTKMESREAFQIMENFAETIGDGRYQEYLFKILSRKSPFANFKAEIESSSYRQQWFDFRDRSYEAYVRAKLEFEGFELG